jgi:hypothetical protein
LAGSKGERHFGNARFWDRGVAEADRVGEGLDFDLDVYDRGCHAKGSNYGIEASGAIGLGPHIEAEAHLGEESWWNANYNVPDTPFGGSIGTDGITIPTIGVGEAAVVGVGGTFYF